MINLKIGYTFFPIIIKIIDQPRNRKIIIDVFKIKMFFTGKGIKFYITGHFNQTIKSITHDLMKVWYLFVIQIFSNDFKNIHDLNLQ